MEKFSNWRDGPTGIHPLIPPKSKSVSVFGYIIKFGIGPILSLIRVPFVLIFTLLLILVNYLTTSIPIGFISKFTTRLFDIILCRLILYLMGFIQLDEFTETLSRSKVASGSITNYSNKDVVICNHSSYIDIIYLQYRYSPTFSIPPNDNQSQIGNKLIKLTLWRALENAIFSPLQLSSNSIESDKLVQEIIDSNGPLVILPEGTTSNGQGLLDISNVFSSSSSHSLLSNGLGSIFNIHIVGITYHYSIYSPCYSSVTNWLFHLFKVCSQISNGIQIHYLSRSCLPVLSKSSQFSQQFQSQQFTNEWFDNCFKSLSSLINIRRTKINSNDKLSFIAKWKGYKTDYSTNKKSN